MKKQLAAVMAMTMLESAAFGYGGAFHYQRRQAGQRAQQRQQQRDGAGYSASSSGGQRTVVADSRTTADYGYHHRGAGEGAGGISVGGAGTLDGGLGAAAGAGGRGAAGGGGGGGGGASGGADRGPMNAPGSHQGGDQCTCGGKTSSTGGAAVDHSKPRCPGGLVASAIGDVGAACGCANAEQHMDAGGNCVDTVVYAAAQCNPGDAMQGCAKSGGTSGTGRQLCAVWWCTNGSAYQTTPPTPTCDAGYRLTHGGDGLSCVADSGSSDAKMRLITTLVRASGSSAQPSGSSATGGACACGLTAKFRAIDTLVTQGGALKETEVTHLRPINPGDPAPFASTQITTPRSFASNLPSFSSR